MINYNRTQSTSQKTLRASAVGLAIFFTAAIVGTFVYQTALSSPRFEDVVRDRLEKVRDIESEVKIRVDDRDAPVSPPGAPPRDENWITEDSGILPDGVTVFESAYPGVVNLAPELLETLREAATDAAIDGIVFYVTSGWRSPAYQRQLLHEAVAQYGSEEEAARWVASPETSAHVSGDAVDIGPYDAIAWLAKRGAAYGLCQIYGNEPWHFELDPQAIEHGCAPMYPDPTYDPRMQP